MDLSRMTPWGVGHHSSSIVFDVLSSSFSLEEKDKYKTRDKTRHCQCSDVGSIVLALTKQWQKPNNCLNYATHPSLQRSLHNSISYIESGLQVRKWDRTPSTLKNIPGSFAILLNTSLKMEEKDKEKIRRLHQVKPIYRDRWWFKFSDILLLQLLFEATIWEIEGKIV